ncbi:MAG: hypothetical protein C4567_03800 [Deltaproteobacteria bacterium]|nr:MAG: hypothetical protein C4567_03800 [Deltaproteobacteria bacterium]
MIGLISEMESEAMKKYLRLWALILVLMSVQPQLANSQTDPFSLVGTWTGSGPLVYYIYNSTKNTYRKNSGTETVTLVIKSHNGALLTGFYRLSGKLKSPASIYITGVLFSGEIIIADFFRGRLVTDNNKMYIEGYFTIPWLTSQEDENTVWVTGRFKLSKK